LEKLQDQLVISGAAPTTWILDNETSHELQSAMTKYKTMFQFITPHTHRANIAEQAIQIFKSHFKAELASAHPDFPIAEWDPSFYHPKFTPQLKMQSKIVSLCISLW